MARGSAWGGWAVAACSAGGEAVMPHVGRPGCNFARLTHVCPNCLSRPREGGETSLSASSSVWKGIAFKLVLTAGLTVPG